MILIDSILTLPGIIVEKEYKRRIAIINVVIVVCDTEEGTPSRPRAPLLEYERLKMYKNPGSLSRYFVNKYIKPFPNDIYCEYNIYREKLISKSGLLNYM
ncbi:hypothetical protein N7445_006191 [Penicillium cf. griseofulvum]|nr:hypothetical protein N7445_006191 [Penicillium cf. griseofulvum]